MQTNIQIFEKCDFASFDFTTKAGIEYAEKTAFGLEVNAILLKARALQARDELQLNSIYPSNVTAILRRIYKGDIRRGLVELLSDSYGMLNAVLKLPLYQQDQLERKKQVSIAVLDAKPETVELTEFPADKIQQVFDEKRFENMEAQQAWLRLRREPSVANVADVERRRGELVNMLTWDELMRVVITASKKQTHEQRVNALQILTPVLTK